MLLDTTEMVGYATKSAALALRIVHKGFLQGIDHQVYQLLGNCMQFQIGYIYVCDLVRFAANSN